MGMMVGLMSKFVIRLPEFQLSMNYREQLKPCQPIPIPVCRLSQMQSLILNHTLIKMKQRLSSRLPSNPCVSTSTPTIPVTTIQIQTQPHLMYSVIEQQLKHVYEEVNRMKDQLQEAKEKAKGYKESLKVQRTEKAVLRAEVERVAKEKGEAEDREKGLREAIRGDREEVRVRVQKMKEAYDGMEKQLMQAQFKSLQLEQQLKKIAPKPCTDQSQQTTPPPPPAADCSLTQSPSSFLTLQLPNQIQLSQQLSALQHKVTSLTQSLNLKNLQITNLNSQIGNSNTVIATLQSEVRELLGQLSKRDLEIHQLKGASNKMKSQKQMQEEEFADMMECFVREKTQFVEARKRQVEAQFVNMEKAYRAGFEENIQLKKHLCQTKAEVQHLQKIIKQKQLKFNLQVAQYERKLHNMQNDPMITKELSARTQRAEQELSRMRQQISTRDNQLHQINLSLSKTKFELEEKDKLLKELEFQATNKLKQLGQRYEQLVEYNQMLMGQNTELKKKGQNVSAKDAERMRKMYLSIWKQRFNSY